jgi:thioredoxin 1
MGNSFSPSREGRGFFCKFAPQKTRQFLTKDNMMEIITDATFEEKVMKSDKLAVIDFSAEWCGPCRLVSPIIHELAGEYQDRIVAGEVNVDENPQITAQYKVRNIPTVLYLKNGEVVDKQVGAVPKSVYRSLLEKHI